MLEALTLTQALSVLIGLFLIAGGVGVMADPGLVSRLLDEMKRGELVAMLAGVAAFAVGAAIVAIHNDWSTPRAIVVSAVGWIALAKGVAFIALRRWVMPLISTIALPATALRVIAGALIVIGAWLGFGGLAA